MLWIRGLSTVATLLATVSAGEGSCPAGAGASCTAAPASTAGSRGAAKSPVQPSADLITQEVDELTAFKQLCVERIELLESLKQTIDSGVNVSLPEKHVRLLKEQLPLMSEITTDEERTPSSSADDYLLSKVIIPQQEPVSFIEFLPLKSRVPTTGPQTPSPVPSSFLVTAQTDGSVRLFGPTGELVLSFSAGHDQPVTNLVTNSIVTQSQEESFITTADAGGLIRVHKVDARLRRITKEKPSKRSAAAHAQADKVSEYLSSKLNVTSKFVVQMQMPSTSSGEPSVVTALAVASQQGARYFVAGDAEGKVSVFSRNGSFTAALDAAVTPGAKVEALHPHLGSLLFHVGTEWGFINLDKMVVQHMDCPEFEGRVAAAVIDRLKSARVLIADEEGVVWAFNVKEKKNCKLEHRFAKGLTLPPLELASTDGFALAFERAGIDRHVASISAINMTHVGRRKAEMGSAVVWRRDMPAVRDWAFHKRHLHGDLLAFLSEDGREVEVLEVLNMQVYQPKIGEDPFSNFKMPVIAVAVVLVLGYQYMKQKGKFSGGGGGGGKGFKNDKFDLDSAELAKMREKIRANKATSGAAGGGLDLGGD